MVNKLNDFLGGELIVFVGLIGVIIISIVSMFVYTPDISDKLVNNISIGIIGWLARGKIKK